MKFGSTEWQNVVWDSYCVLVKHCGLSEEEWIRLPFFVKHDVVIAHGEEIETIRKLWARKKSVAGKYRLKQKQQP